MNDKIGDKKLIEKCVRKRIRAQKQLFYEFLLLDWKVNASQKHQALVRHNTSPQPLL